MANVFYMSFADGNLPRGSQFLGAAIVHAETPENAISTAWEKCINPGGEVMVFGPEPEEKFKANCLYRLLNADEARSCADV